MFNDERLQKIYEDSKPIVNAHLEKLDKISQDIKTLESILKESCVINGMVTFTEDNLKGYSLFWDGNRIVLVKGDHEYSHPLIESKAYVRLASYKYLSELMEKCLKGIC